MCDVSVLFCSQCGEREELKSPAPNFPLCCEGYLVPVPSATSGSPSPPAVAEDYGQPTRFLYFHPRAPGGNPACLGPTNTNCLTLCKHWCRVSTLGAPPTSWWAAVAGCVALAWAGVSLWAVHVRLR